jgi:dienelactone hydrolase
MTKLYAFVLVPLVLTLTVATAWGQTSGGPETVIVHSGSATLHAMLWRPQGRGPFPAILLNHGSGRTREDLERLGPYEGNAEKLGPVFARHGYVFLYLFRRGVGLSTDQGSNAVDLMNSESAAHGQEARNALQLQLLENREMDDALSGLKFLRALPYVDARNVAVIGHSFGGSLTVLLAEREPNLRAVVVFSGAGYSYDRSPELRSAPVAAIASCGAGLFLYARTITSLSSGKVRDARREHIGATRLKFHPPIGHTQDDVMTSILVEYLGARRVCLQTKTCGSELPGGWQ